MALVLFRLAAAGCMCVCERERELEGGASYALECFASFDCYAGTSVALAGAKGRGASKWNVRSVVSSSGKSHRGSLF